MFQRRKNRQQHERDLDDKGQTGTPFWMSSENLLHIGHRDRTEPASFQGKVYIWTDNGKEVMTKTEACDCLESLMQSFEISPENNRKCDLGLLPLPALERLN